MRVVHVNHRYAPFIGGSEQVIQQIAERMARDGNQVRVVTSDAFDLEYFWDPSRRRVNAPAAEVIGGVAVERVPVRHVPASSFVFRGLRRAMGELSRLPLPARPFAFAAARQPWLPGLEAAIGTAGQVDLVHATNLGLEGLAVSAHRVAQRHRAAFALTPFIHLGDPGSVSRRYVSMPHQLKLLRTADTVLTMTETEAEFVASVGVPSRRVEAVGAGIDVDAVSGGDAAAFRKRYGIAGALVGCLGALAPGKGTTHLVEAVGRLRQAGHDVQLVLAGPALSDFDRWYTALDPEARDGIHVLGVVSDAVRRDLLAAIDVFAMPSRTESFGIVYLEAWANRKPVVAADVGAVSELVRQGENGLLVSFGDVPQIVDALLTLLRDHALATKLGTAGHRLMIERFTWDRVIERVYHAFGSAVGYPIERGMAR